MKQFYIVVLLGATLYGMEKSHCPMSVDEKISLLEAISMGSFQIHATCIEFPHFIKNSNSKYLVLQTDIYQYFQDLISNTKTDEFLQQNFIKRFQPFIKSHPDFLKKISTEEAMKEFLSLFQYEYVGTLSLFPEHNKKLWENFLAALQNNDIELLQSIKKTAPFEIFPTKK